jgi:hypothetical protein
MYAIYHQIDREKREQEEKENEQNLVKELKQLEQKYNQLLRRDSYSTITTHDTEMIIETKMERKHLAPITWSQNGELPIEISVPETTRKMDKNLLGNHENSVNDDSPACEPPTEQDHGLQILQNTLFVDDEDELDLIFDDNHEDEMNVQRTLGRPMPQDVLSSSSESSAESFYTNDQEDKMNVYQQTFGTPTSKDVSLISSSDSSDEESLYTDDTGRDSEDLVRFEMERFTRFEI